MRWRVDWIGPGRATTATAAAATAAAATATATATATAGTAAATRQVPHLIELGKYRFNPLLDVLLFFTIPFKMPPLLSTPSTPHHSNLGKITT